MNAVVAAKHDSPPFHPAKKWIREQLGRETAFPVSEWIPGITGLMLATVAAYIFRMKRRSMRRRRMEA
jgi:hypothetical protein